MKDYAHTRPFYRTGSFAGYVLTATIVLALSFYHSTLSVVDMLAATFIYIYANTWIYCYLFRRTMYMPTIGTTLEKGKQEGYRLLLFILGLLLTGTLLLSINGFFKNA